MKYQNGFKQTEIGMIPEDWEIKKVGDFVDIKHGYAFKGEFFTDKSNENIVLTPGNFNIGGGFKTEKFKYTTEAYPDEYVLKEGDIIVTMTDLSKEGDTLGYAAKIPCESRKKFLHNQRLGLLKFKSKISQDFLYWLLRTKRYNIFIVGSATGSTVKHTSPNRIKQYSFGIPLNYAEQEQIAKILSDLDSKIELDHKMNKILEEIGKIIFKHWFIDLEFPNEEGMPYKSSSGEMIYNEELGKEIPKGWTVTTLDQAAEFTRGFSYKGSEKSKTDGEHVFVTLNSVKEFGGFKREFSYITSDRTKEKHFVQKGDIVVANTEQTKTGTLLGCPALVEFPFRYEKDKGVFSHHITKVVSKLKNFKHYLYYYLFINQQNAVKYNTGSVIWALDVSNWSKNEKIILPRQEVLLEFESLMENMFLKSLENNLQIETLSHLRGSLLPKLMSGKIRVPVEVR